MNRAVPILMILGGLLMIIDGVLLVDISMDPAILSLNMVYVAPPSLYMYTGLLEAVVGILLEAIFFAVIITRLNHRVLGLIGLLLSLISLIGVGGFLLGFIFSSAASIMLIREK